MSKRINTNKQLLRGPVPLSHLLLARMLHHGDKVVDATCGNGGDTLLLARLVGENGHVWGFDIQAAAIVETCHRLKADGLHARATLLNAGHEHLSQYVTEPLDAVIFNLGYLPGGDRAVVTTPHTTLAALSQAKQLLVPGGVLLVVIYPGHEGGNEERAAIEDWAVSLEQSSVSCWRMGQINVKSDAPYLLFLQKL